MKNLKLSVVLKSKDKYYSITICPYSHGYVIEYFFKERTKTGKPKIKKVVVDALIEDVEIPYISVENVKHLGYTSHQYLEEANFYINFYK